MERLSNPYWFQAFGCVLGFDWHSSGLTTTTIGALKETLELETHGITVQGGKGGTSRKTPQEIENTDLKTSTISELRNISRKSASVDNSCVQDSFNLYHHNLIFTEKGEWCVVRQGMNSNYARRYHWLHSEIEDIIEEPQSAICSMKRKDETLNLVSKNQKKLEK